MAKQQQDSPDPRDDPSFADTGKGRPTPKRREAQAAKKRPLVPADRKAATKADKARQREQRAKAQQAMMAGDERYLPARDRGPIRRFVRDYIDARWNVAELFLPASFVIIVGVLFMRDLQWLSLATILALYLLIIVSVGDAVIATRRIRRRVVAKFGTYPRGTTMYAVMRAFQLRRTRVPRPQVNRREYPS